MALHARSLTRQRLCLEFASLKRSCPQGVYVAPLPEAPLQWTGVLFARTGPYADAILRFNIAFPDDYPNHAPVIAFTQDVFHPLVTPLTTYSYSSRDRDTETVSAADDGRLPPGGLNLREGFPEWFVEDAVSGPSSPHITHVLHYMRLVFSKPEIMNGLALAAAANPSAWHAWQSHSAKTARKRTQSPVVNGVETDSSGSEKSSRSMSPRGSGQQPGGARRPGEWNWTGVWEERIRKIVLASKADGALFGVENADVIAFSKLDDATLITTLAAPQPQIA